MNIKHLIKILVVSSLVVGLTACSSKRHGGAAGVTDASEMGLGAGMNGNGGTYAEGYGGSGGFQPSTSCNVPGNPQSYYFDFNSNDLHANDMGRVQSEAQSLGSKGRHVSVVGNTDSRGSREYNVALGWRRANAVSTALQQAGVSKGQIYTNSNGAEKPIAFGSSEDDYQCNRRVDVTEE